MVFMFLPAWLLALLPGIIGGFAKSAMSQSAVNRMNWYNSPASQMRRFHATGLPTAAMTDMSAGNQSSLPDVSGIGDAISNFQITKGQMLQQDMLLEQIRKMVADADISENARDISNIETDVAKEVDTIAGVSRPKGGWNKLAEYRMKSAALSIAKNQSIISDIELRIKKATEENEIKKVKADLDKLLMQLDMGGQAMENERIRTVARNAIINRMEKNGLSLMEAMLIQVMTSLSGRAGGSNFGIGF